MEYEKQPQTPADAPVKIYQPQVKTVAVRQQTGFLDHAPVRIYEKPPKQQASPFPTWESSWKKTAHPLERRRFTAIWNS